MKEKCSSNQNTGLLLPVVEEFYSIQGEGFHAGKAAYFLRLGGCDVGCRWCDSKYSWDISAIPPVAIEDILQRIISVGCSDMVITGGEPLLYNVGPLCNELKKRNIKTYLETSGTYPLSGTFDWICLSPKRQAPPLQEMLSVADELKIIVSDHADFAWAEENAAKVNSACHLFLQPEWSKISVVMPQIVEYVLAHTQWKVSLQMHKYMNIP